jgi:glycolate dehydrogenase FAD-binding subunit
MTADPPLIEDFRPQLLERPATVAELGGLIRRAAADNLGLYPFGGGTMLHLGLPPTRPGIAVDMTALNQVIDYPARDMTITVQAGITMAKLQEILDKENQLLPIDTPLADKATLGGAIAVNASGPRRYGYGTLRDYVIGISFMNDAGQEVKAGGRVVKNVAGYDMCKLHIGALGTLGIVTQVTLKVKPRAEMAAMLLSSDFGAHDLAPRLDVLHRTKTRPVAVDVVTARVTMGQDAHFAADRLRIWILFEDSVGDVRWQGEQLQKESNNAFEDTNDPDVINGLIARINRPEALVHFRANLLSSALAEFLQAAVALIPPPNLYAHAGNGIVYGHWNDDFSMPHAVEMLTALGRLSVRHQGNLIVTRCPPAWKRELKVWGEPRGDLALMRAVKRELDPRDLFNPGRFLV